jgi:hypothetical protein
MLAVVLESEHGPNSLLIGTHHRNPTDTVRLKAALAAFHAGTGDGAKWTRSAFIAAVAADYVVGRDCRGRMCIAGISEAPPQRLAVDAASRLIRVA